VPYIARQVGGSLTAQAEKVYSVMTGGTFPAAQKAAGDARRLHAHVHGHNHSHA
jgi:hypothetical protein